MASWRDSASAQAQDDFDELLTTVLPFAEQTLARYGELFPFGAAVTTDGVSRMTAADPDLGEHPGSVEVLGALYLGTRKDRARYRAVAFVADVRLQDGSDAVRVELEHREGVCLQLLLPYTRQRLRRRVTFADMRVSLAEPRTWTD